MAKAYIDENGFNLPTYQEIIEDLKAEYKAIYGEDVYLEADSQDGQLLSVFALRIYDCYTLALQVYNSFSPHTAQGNGLSAMVRLNGIKRKISSYSTVDLLIIGKAGTFIQKGIATDKNQTRWLLPENIIIPLEGEILVNAKASIEGNITAPAYSITEIFTPIRGWESVTNPQEALAGAPVETDYTLRQRQALSVAIPSRSIFEGSQGAVAGVLGVTRFKAYENDTNITDIYGLPPHSICFVVEGGNVQDIANAIAIKKSPGCYSYGDIETTVYDFHGVSNTIRFFRPLVKNIAFEIKIKPLVGYKASIENQIKENVYQYINRLEIGENLLLSKLYTPINNAEPIQNTRTFDTINLEIGIVGESLASQNVEIDFKSVATISKENIAVIVST